MRKLFATIVGSRAFDAHTPTSDYDIHEVYLTPLNELLRQPFWHPRPKETKLIDANSGDKYEYVQIEISSLIAQLIKGNFNAYITTMSPKVQYDNDVLEQLKVVVKRNMSKNIYDSIVGFTHSMTKDYAVKGDVKRIRVARRILSFGIGVLEGEFRFDPHAEMIQQSSDDLKEKLYHAYDNSKLPEEPNKDEYLDLLREIRLG